MALVNDAGMGELGRLTCRARDIEEGLSIGQALLH
jgi:hypothetical protein